MSSAVAKIPDLKGIEMPYMLRVYGVTEEMFDEMVDDEDTKAELVDGVLVVHSPASIPHDRMVTFVSGLLSFYVEESSLESSSGRAMRSRGSSQGGGSLPTCSMWPKKAFRAPSRNNSTDLPIW